MKFLFIFGNNRKVVDCDPHKDAVMAAFSTTFHQDASLVQRYVAEFEDFVDDDDLVDLKDFEKLKFFCRSEAVGSTGTAGTESHESSDTDDEDNDQPSNIPDVDRRKRFGGKQIPANYQLPSFGSCIDKRMEDKLPLTPDQLCVLKKRIVKDMKKNYCKDLCPAGFEYTRVVDALISKNPTLCDIDVLKANGKKRRYNGESLKISLERSWKHIRATFRDKPGFEHLIQMAKTFSPLSPKPNPRRKRDELTAAQGPLPRLPENLRTQHQPNLRYGPGETERSTADHKARIREEWIQDNPNLDVVKARMDSSQFIRWHEFRDNSVAKMQSFYPNLTNGIQWVAEMERQTGYNLRERREAFLTQDRTEFLMELLQGKRGCKRLLEKFGATASQGHKEDVVFACLPYLCRDAMKTWLVIDKPVTILEPTLRVLTKRDQANPFEDADFMPYLDKTPLVKETTLTVCEAFDVLVSAVHLFNAAYAPENLRSWRVLCEAIYALPSEQDITPCLQEIVNVVCRDL